MTAEVPKRLKPRPETLRELFLGSGNICAFPGCVALMMDEGGNFIGQLCHIEAAEPRGERFNPLMTNEQRRGVSNLMLMCYEHHVVTNDIVVFPVDKMRQIKADHESRFSDPGRVILAELKDWTTDDKHTVVSNMKTYDRITGGLSGLTSAQVAEVMAELNAYIERLCLVPMATRRFVGKVAERMHRMRKTRVVSSGRSSEKILISDLANAFRVSEHHIAQNANELDGYKIGCIDQIDTDLGPKGAVAIWHLNSGWPLWTDLAGFCEKAHVPMEAFSEDLDFGRLDT